MKAFFVKLVWSGQTIFIWYGI